MVWALTRPEVPCCTWPSICYACQSLTDVFSLVLRPHIWQLPLTQDL